MKKSKENEHRISNLKDMLNNVKDEDINESADNSEDVFDIKDDEEYEEDKELLAYLHDTDDNKEYEIDDEFIYRPDSDSTPGENLEKKEINEDYIIKTKLDDITLFHTDRGNEFKNRIIDEVLDTFKIKRSLSMKGCPYDNAVAEATFKIFKTEFANNYYFESLEQLEIMLADYVNWFNNKRIHGALGYMTPTQYKNLVSA